MNSMARLSRRAFLRLSATLSAAMGSGRGFNVTNSEAIDGSPTLARTFKLTPVYRQPEMTSAVCGGLAPHSVHAIETGSVPGGWYRTEHGYVLQTAIQPISPYVPPVIELHSAAPFWAEVVAPVSSSRAWCSMKAPLIATWGHGAVTKILGTLTDDYGVVWYETGSGWFDARQWQRIRVLVRLKPHIHGVSISINPTKHELLISPKEQNPWRTAYFGGSTIINTFTSTIQTDMPGDGSGTAWLMHLSNGITVCGAWDHNRFGLAGGEEIIELPIAAARRLFRQIALSDFETYSE